MIDIESWFQEKLAKLSKYLDVGDDKKQAQFALHGFWHAFITYTLITIYPKWWMVLPNIIFILVKEVYIDKYGWKKAFTHKDSITDLLSRFLGAITPLIALLWI